MLKYLLFVILDISILSFIAFTMYKRRKNKKEILVSNFKEKKYDMEMFHSEPLPPLEEGEYVKAKI